jgi:hypothetical protein
MRRSSGAYIVLRVHLESIGNSAQATSKRFPFGQPAFHRRRVWSPDQDRMRVSSFVSRAPLTTVAHADYRESSQALHRRTNQTGTIYKLLVSTRSLIILIKKNQLNH